MHLFYINLKLKEVKFLGRLKKPNRLSLFFISENRKRGMRTMSRLFMYDTSLEGIEQLMMLVPNFHPRRSGIVINNYFNWEGGVKDCNCNVINAMLVNTFLLMQS